MFPLSRKTNTFVFRMCFMLFEEALRKFNKTYIRSEAKKEHKILFNGLSNRYGEFTNQF